MTFAKKVWSPVEQVLQNPLVILIATAISIVSLTIALSAQGQATKVASQRAQLAQEQTVFLSATFCDVFQPIATAGRVPTTAPRSAIGNQLIGASERVEQNLGCTPDPYDHK